MEVFKIVVKLFVADGDFAPPPFVPILHRWIQSQGVPGHLLIDVADYARMAAGPGTVLISSEANFHLDREENRLGLTYARKLAMPGDFSQRLRGAIAEALKAAAKLEQEPELAGKLKFRTDEIVVRLNDRLLAPNTPQTAATAEPELRAAAKVLFAGKPVTIESKVSPLTLAELRLKASDNPPVEILLERLGAS